MRAFGGYSFPKSHAAAFAALVYRSAWLKVYHPKELYCGLLNHQPMGFWAPAIVINDAKRRGIAVLPPDLHQSAEACTVEGDAIRIGLKYIKGFGEDACARLLRARTRQPFTDLKDLGRRTRLPKRLVEHLILSGTLDGWGERRALLWQLGKLTYSSTPLGLEFDDDDVQLKPMSEEEMALAEFQMLGLSLREHPMKRYRAKLTQQGILDSAAIQRCPDGARVRVAGLIVVHQSPPTAHGVHFVTLEDECGLFDLIIFPDVYERVRRVVRGHSLLLVEGIIQQDEGVTNVLAGSVQPLRDSG